jgi:hypothetical protein
MKPSRVSDAKSWEHLERSDRPARPPRSSLPRTSSPALRRARPPRPSLQAAPAIPAPTAEVLVLHRDPIASPVALLGSFGEVPFSPKRVVGGFVRVSPRGPAWGASGFVRVSSPGPVGRLLGCSENKVVKFALVRSCSATSRLHAPIFMRSGAPSEGHDNSFGEVLRAPHEGFWVRSGKFATTPR